MSTWAEPFFCESRLLQDANRFEQQDDARITAAAFAPVSVDCCPSAIPPLPVRSRRFRSFARPRIEPLGSTRAIPSGSREPGGSVLWQASEAQAGDEEFENFRCVIVSVIAKAGDG